MFYSPKIVLIGPESSGKTTLSNALSLHYDYNLAEEYARAYLNKNGSNYDFKILMEIAKGQAALEELNYDIYDTDLYVIKVWLEEKFDKQIDWVENAISNYENRIYLLCNYDIPYEIDLQREHPSAEDRERLYNRYKYLLESSNHPFLEVDGNLNERFKKSINFIDSIKKM